MPHRSAVTGHADFKSQGHIRWVNISKMKVHPVRQRQLKRAWVDARVDHFNPEALAQVTLNHTTEDDTYWVIDGQHRVALMRAVGWGDQNMEARVYENLTPEQEANLFLLRNDARAVDPLNKFLVAVEAGWAAESDIQRILNANGVAVGRKRGRHRLTAVGAVHYIYDLDVTLLAKVVQSIHGALPDHPCPWDSVLIYSVGMVFHRYNGGIDVPEMIEVLAHTPGGLRGLTQKATLIRDTHGGDARNAHAAAIVELVNAKRGKAKRKRVESWWRVIANGNGHA
jgi:hypothetical protein